MLLPIAGVNSIFRSFFGEFSRLPFDWKNPFVYFFVTIVETAGALALFWFLAFLMVYPLGGHLFNWTFVENWKRELEIINELLKTKKTRTKISKRFTQFIRSHSRVKQLSVKYDQCQSIGEWSEFVFIADPLTIFRIFTSTYSCWISLAVQSSFAVLCYRFKTKSLSF